MHQTYLKYKNSGLEWTRNIPADWGEEKIVTLFDFPNEKVSDVDYEPLSVTYGGVKKQIENAAKTDNSSNRRLVRVGDIVFNGRSDRRGAVGISNYEGSVSVIYHVLRKRYDNLSTKYYHHLFRNTLFSQEFYRLGRGIVDDLWTTRSNEMKRIQVPVPPPDTQKCIATFLDNKTRIIDELIAKKKHLIELLKEKSQALITRAVTKGLDPNAKMKPSGIEWLEEIPVGWEIKRLKYGIKYQEGPGIMADDFREEGVPLLRIGNLSIPKVTLEGCNFLDEARVKTKWNHFKLNSGDLLISASATTGIVSEVVEESEGSIAYTGIIRLTPIKDVADKNYVKYFVVCNYYLSQIAVLQAGSAMQHYGPSHLRRMNMIFPPIDEQTRIAKYLDKMFTKINKTIAVCEEQLAKIREYRSSLVYAAVTGKVRI